MAKPARLLADRVIVITGGGRGIGAMIAEGFVSAGAKTYIAGRKPETLDETVKALDKQGEIIPIPADLSTEAGCRALADEIAKREKHLEVLVNNAGATWGAPLEEYPDKAFDRCWDLNVRGVFHLTRFLVPLLKASASAESPARVINIGSIDGIRAPVVENYAYAASKAAVHQLTRVLARKLASNHITVNAIAPGFFPSRMTRATLAQYGADNMARLAPLQRLGDDDDLKGAALLFASQAGKHITGQTLAVDGGISAIIGAA
jgi:NAD(P)-dependent dehydrogenase (short-subunit alcohol dehydrogenase family)